MTKPGIMLYFELRPCIDQLQEKEKAELLVAMMDYGEYGSVPELSERVGLIWPLIRQKLDRDTKRYEQTVQNKRYAAYVRDCKYHGNEPLRRTDWEKAFHHVISADITCNQNGDSGIQTTNYKPQTTDFNLQTADCNLQTIDCKLQTPYYKPQSHFSEFEPTPYIFSPPDQEAIQAFCREENLSLDVESFWNFYASKGWMVGNSPMVDWKAAVRRWCRKERSNESAGDIHEWGIGTVV